MIAHAHRLLRVVLLGVVLLTASLGWAQEDAPFSAAHGDEWTVEQRRSTFQRIKAEAEARGLPSSWIDRAIADLPEVEYKGDVGGGQGASAKYDAFSTNDIWIELTFDPDNMSPDDINSMAHEMWHWWFDTVLTWAFSPLARLAHWQEEAVAGFVGALVENGRLSAAVGAAVGQMTDEDGDVSDAVEALYRLEVYAGGESYFGVGFADDRDVDDWIKLIRPYPELRFLEYYLPEEDRQRLAAAIEDKEQRDADIEKWHEERERREEAGLSVDDWGDGEAETDVVPDDGSATRPLTGDETGTNNTSVENDPSDGPIVEAPSGAVEAVSRRPITGGDSGEDSDRVAEPDDSIIDEIDDVPATRHITGGTSAGNNVVAGGVTPPPPPTTSAVERPETGDGDLPRTPRPRTGDDGDPEEGDGRGRRVGPKVSRVIPGIKFAIRPEERRRPKQRTGLIPEPDPKLFLRFRGNRDPGVQLMILDGPATQQRAPLVIPGRAELRRDALHRLWAPLQRVVHRGRRSRVYASALARPTSAMGLVGQKSGNAAVQMFLTAMGSSTGEAFQAHFVGMGSEPIEIDTSGLVIEPLKKKAQKRIQKELRKLAKDNPLSVNLDAYCLELLRKPPSKGMMFRVADAELQKHFAPVRSVLRSRTKISSPIVYSPTETSVRVVGIEESELAHQ